MKLDYTTCPKCLGKRYFPKPGRVDTCETCKGDGVIPTVLEETGSTDVVVRLFDRKPVDSTPPVDDRLVSCLEDLLSDAKAGKILSFGLAAVSPDGAATTYTHNHPSQSRITLVGAIARLLHNTNREIDT